MAYVKTQAMEKLICEVLFRSRAVPATYYLGLGQGPLPAKTATLADVDEITGPGYARIALARGLVDFPTLILAGTDWKVTALAQHFINSGGADWEQAEYGFLATSADNSGELLGVIEVDAFTNHDGDSGLTAIFEYQDT